MRILERRKGFFKSTPLCHFLPLTPLHVYLSLNLAQVLCNAPCIPEGPSCGAISTFATGLPTQGFFTHFPEASLISPSGHSHPLGVGRSQVNNGIFFC